MAPRTPELEVVQAQAARLRTITGGTDWHSRIGERVLMEPVAEPDPPLHVALARVECAPDQRWAGTVSATWVAVVPIARSDALDPLLVLADLRAALQCDDDETTISAAEVELRSQGSNYAVVTITADVYVSIG